ncbi:MAG TPA: DUF423 domain-containing protein [Bacillales bacterium]|nr:DUF423 domain-containing protein [Bacillales bacterium]
MKVFVSLGSIMAFLGVAIGAFGAHSLKNVLTEKWAGVYETGVHYHLIHALGIILIGILVEKFPGALMNWAGWLLFAGILLFSGSLYVLSITKINVIGAITPIGGVAFLAGWVLVVIAVLKA